MLLLLGGFLLLMLLGLPVALSMAVSSLVYILVTGITPDVTLAQRMIAGVESFPLLAVPFFILAGNLMNIAGVTGRIYKFAVALVGWMRGGLGHVNIIGSVVFAGMSGTAIADAAGLGTIEIKANEAKLVDLFKQKGLTVTEVNKDEFRDTVLKNVSFESFDYRKADWERIQAVK